MTKTFLGILIAILSFVNLQAQDGDLIFHTVKQGETKYGISREYNISIEQLERYNPEIRTGLKIGMKIMIPEPKEGAEKAPEDSTAIKHTVKKGDTFYSLSREYGVSIAELKAANNGLPQGLRINQVIIIPEKSESEVQEPGKILENYFVIEVEPKQTAYSISKEYEISLDSLYILNPGIEDGLQIGQVIKLPKNRKPENVTVVVKPQENLNTDDSLSTAKPGTEEAKIDTSGGYLLYQVKTGDSFYALKQRYNISQSELLKLNPELSNGLKVGNYIIIPRERKKKEELGFFEKLFKKVEETEQKPLPPVSNQRKARKDSLNNTDIPNRISNQQLKVIEDTIRVDFDKNYRVGVMLPFFARQDTAVDLGFDDRSKIALEFYQGLLMAADTLSEQGMNLTLRVLDTENSKYKMRQLIPEVERSQFDLVIGPLYKDNVEMLADKLMDKDIMVVSPLSRTVDVSKRPNLINARQNRLVQAVYVADILNKQYPGHNVVFAINGMEDSHKMEQALKSRLAPRDSGTFIRSISSIENETIDKDELKEELSDEGPNVVVVLSEDPTFLNGIVNSLSIMRNYDVSLVAPARVMDIETMDLKYLDDLKLTMADNQYTDYRRENTVDFIAKYRERFKGEPSLIAFQGYDVGLYFLNKLWRSGVYLPLTIQERQELLSTGFDIRQKPEGGYENEFLHVIGIRDLELVKLEKEKQD